MKIDELVMLTKAGFTKADIEAMGILDSKPEEIQPVQHEEVKPEEVKPEEQKPANDYEDKIKSLETKLDYVINRFNYMSVKESSQPEQKAETLDDILAKVLR